MKSSSSNVMSKLKNIPKPFVIIGEVAIGVLLLVLIGILIANALTSGNPFKSKQQLVNYLNPSAELKVGDYRYYSPCQVMPQQAVEQAFGKFKDRTTVSDEFIDSSVPKPSGESVAAPDSVETSCTYTTLGGDDITLKAVQYFDLGDSRDLTNSTDASEGSIDTKLDSFDEAVKAKSSQELKDFVAEAKAGVKLYEQSREDRFSDEDYKTADEIAKETKYDGKVIPSSNEPLGFSVVYENIAYQFEYALNDDTTFEDELNQDPAKLAEQLEKVAKVMEVIGTNAMNKQLSQSPSPTAPRGINKPHESIILEPCAVLTSPVFKSVTAKDPNGSISRTSVEMNVTEKQYSPKNKVQSFPRNSCERKSELESESGASDNVSVIFDLETGSSKQEVDTFIEKAWKLDADDTQLQTNADWAAEFVDNSDPDLKAASTYVFRVGNYIGEVRISKLTSSGGSLFDDIQQPVGTREEHIKAINELTASLKTHLAEAEKNPTN